MDELDLKSRIKRIPIDKIDINVFNANIVPDKIMKLLEKSIERDGFVQPILVRPVSNNRYELIDGEHRYRILKSKDEKEIEAVILEKDEDQAKLLSLIMNRHGEFDTLKLAGVLHNIGKEYTPEQIEELLGYDKIEQISFDDVLNFDFKDLVKPLKDDESENYELFMVDLTEEQLEILNEACLLTGNIDKGKSLLEILLFYQKQYGTEQSIPNPAE